MTSCSARDWPTASLRCADCFVGPTKRWGESRRAATAAALTSLPSAASLAERIPPGPELLLDFFRRAALAIGDPGTKAVFPENVVLRNDVLKVPCGIGKRRSAATGGRVGKANPLGAIEHQQEHVSGADIAEIEG